MQPSIIVSRAEKTIKGFLAFHDHDLERTHDLRRLVQIATVRESKFSDWMDAAVTLTPYATAYRYPGESAVLEPSRTEFDEALKLASDFVDFVRSLLPSDVHPGA